MEAIVAIATTMEPIITMITTIVAIIITMTMVTMVATTTIIIIIMETIITMITMTMVSQVANATMETKIKCNNNNNYPLSWLQWKQIKYKRGFFWGKRGYFFLGLGV